MTVRSTSSHTILNFGEGHESIEMLLSGVTTSAGPAAQRGTGKRRIAAHIVFFSVADAMVVSSMTNEGNVWLGVQGSLQKAVMTLHRF